MKSKDQQLLEEAYRAICEQDEILTTRRSGDERVKNHSIAIQKEIQEYIKNGSTGHLSLRGKPVTSLPDGLKVGGILDLTDATGITSLPNGLIVKGGLHLTDTNIEELPKDIQVGGVLMLDGTKIKSLPSNLHVRGSLYLNRTPITELPQGLKVDGDLYLKHTNINKLPDDLVVRDSMYIQNTPLGKKFTGSEFRGYEDAQIAAKKELTKGGSLLNRLLGNSPQIGGKVYVG